MRQILALRRVLGLAWKLSVKEARRKCHSLASPGALIMSGHQTVQQYFKNITIVKDLHDTAIANNMSAVQGTNSRLMRSLPSVCSFMSWLYPFADRPLALSSFTETHPGFLFLKHDCQLIPCSLEIIAKKKEIPYQVVILFHRLIPACSRSDSLQLSFLYTYLYF